MVGARLPADLIARLDGWADASGLSRSEAVRAAIEAIVREPPRGKFQTQVLTEMRAPTRRE